MNFKKYSDLKGQHAFLSPSKYHWVNYDGAKLKETYVNYLALQRGIKLHEFAAECIELRQKLPKTRKTLNMYVNDAIQYKMTPEQPLYYSDVCFGTADAIAFDRGMLRIHDLKTGTVKAHPEQLEIYAALFCLDYDEDVREINIETRIYQNDEIFVFKPSAERIQSIIDKIMSFDSIIENTRADISEEFGGIVYERRNE